jgi:hypothetical protein
MGGKSSQDHSQCAAYCGYFNPEGFIHSNKKAALRGF